MNLETAGAVSEIIGAIGVLATLIYLAIQIRSQNAAMHIQNMRSRASEQRSVTAMQTTPETLERALVKTYSSSEELSVAEYYALEAYLLSFVLLAECDFRLYKDELITADDWLPTRRQIKLYFASPLSRTWWRKVLHDAVTEAFQQEVETVFNEMQGEENPYTLEAMTAFDDRVDPAT